MNNDLFWATVFNNIDFQFASQKYTSATFIENRNAPVDFFVEY